MYQVHKKVIYQFWRLSIHQMWQISKSVKTLVLSKDSSFVSLQKES